MLHVQRAHWHAPLRLLSELDDSGLKLNKFVFRNVISFEKCNK
jgi:hypothetical protein